MFGEDLIWGRSMGRKMVKVYNYMAIWIIYFSTNHKLFTLL